MDLTEQQKVSLAALLHDIGKFRMRAGHGVDDRLKHLYCPTYKSSFSHIHAAHTGKFFEKFEELGVIPKRSPDQEADPNYLPNLSAMHHKPESFLQTLIQRADWLTSGFDREELERYREEYQREIDKGQQHHVRARLVSIFSEVRLPSAKDEKIPESFYDLEPLSPSVRPRSLAELGTTKLDSCESYARLWEKFLEGFNRIPKDGYDNFLGGLISLLESYTWCMPASSFRCYPNSSLFDHLLTTAATANALQGFCTAQNIQNLELFFEAFGEKDFKDTQAFRFIQGDFGGIQDFIFKHEGDSRKFAAKTLRARSFFVSLCSQTAAVKFAQSFGVDQTSIVLSAGGKFTVLVPNLENSEEIIRSVKDEINNSLEKMTYGMTRFYIGSVEFSQTDFQPKAYERVQRKLAENLGNAKYAVQPRQDVFTGYIEEMQEAEGECQLCGYRPGTLKVDEIRICESCRNFKDLGQSLVNESQRFLYLSAEPDQKYELPGGYSFSLGKDPSYKLKKGQVFDICHTGFDGFSQLRIGTYTPVISEADLNSDRYVDTLSEAQWDDIDRHQWDEGANKSFSMLARDSLQFDPEKGWLGAVHLGVLKADVDNLGTLFINGFRSGNENYATISKSLYLSRMVDYFFTTVLQEQIKTDYRSVYTVFAGGDDLFLIGPWTQITKLSEELPRLFANHCGGNPHFHLSAGVSLCRANLPIYSMAEQTEHCLERAKDFSMGDNKKNAVCIFGETVSWSRYQELFAISGELDRLWDQGLTHRFIYRLFTFLEMSANPQQLANLRWRALYQYHITRNYKQKHKEIYQSLVAIPDDWIEKYKSSFRIALSETLYKRRKYGS
jgi:CRISPR-associated protein Csm1